MNCLLFDAQPPFKLSQDSAKFEHIKNVLKAKDGDEIFAGSINGALYVCRLKMSEGYAELLPIRDVPTPQSLPITLCVAFTRPQIAQRILFEAACFGVKKIIFYAASKGETAYAQSALYSKNEYRDWLVKGAQQACATHLPEFQTAENLSTALNLSPRDSTKIAPDIYEATAPISTVLKNTSAKNDILLALGGERGFDNADRQCLRENNFTLVSMGRNVLRTDSAVIAALAICQEVI